MKPTYPGQYRNTKPWRRAWVLKIERRKDGSAFSARKEARRKLEADYREHYGRPLSSRQFVRLRKSLKRMQREADRRAGKWDHLERKAAA